ncbi:hypothetical protein H310_03898 [Aphanomyces invadans]|uniref:B box-type domain-containing protein n=1 Tax=Aphanomyces invadans TaxID=157072 RepID=A0A024UEB1_9STRA|nr:hypothetical protein H310_03898 [Aphanomyces invadans]ETW04751.1 hypothetical protein H310_03898 [Aphanomyces invadans]|eukprot:XP_008866189.1 hypothetical protein H310_03898 [Aphanomyces invadans]
MEKTTTGDTRGNDAVCAVCEIEYVTVICKECRIVFCHSCFDRLHLHTPAVQHHHKVVAQGTSSETCVPLPTSSTATKSQLAIPSSGDVNGRELNFRAPFLRPHPLRIPTITPGTDSGLRDNDNDDSPRKVPRSHHDTSIPSACVILGSGGSARTRNITPVSSATSRHSPLITFNTSPNAANNARPILNPPVAPSKASDTLQQAESSQLSMQALPAIMTHLPHDPLQQQQFLPTMPLSSAHGAAAAIVNDDGGADHTLEDLFFDRFNSVNDQVDCLEAQLADAVTQAMSSTTTAARIHITRQHLQVMNEERLQALSKVIVHSPDLLQRNRGLPSANVQNVPELWTRSFQKLKAMATHLKTAQSNMVELHGLVVECEGRVEMDKKLRTLHEAMENMRRYIASLRSNRHNECIALLSCCEPLRRRVDDELNEQQRRGLIS